MFVFFRLKMVLSVKCLGFQGEVTSYSVLVQGYCKRQFGKFFLVPWPFSLLLSLFVSNPTREREKVELQSVPFVPGRYLVWFCGWLKL